MRFSYATVALPTLSPQQAIDELSAAGYRGVEWKVGQAPHAMGSSAQAFLLDNRCTLWPGQTDPDQIRDACAAAGLAIVGLAPYLTVGDLEALRAVLDLAGALQAPQVRLQTPRPTRGGPGHAVLLHRTRAYLAQAEPLASAAGVRVAVETHQGTVTPSATLVQSLTSHFDPAVIGAIYDVGNVVVEGYEQYDMALDILGPWLHHVHIKNVAALREDSGWRYVWSALDDGLAPVAQVLDSLRRRGYAGWVSVEDLSSARDPVQTLRHNARVLDGLTPGHWPPTGQRGTTT